MISFISQIKFLSVCHKDIFDSWFFIEPPWCGQMWLLASSPILLLCYRALLPSLIVQYCWHRRPLPPLTSALTGWPSWLCPNLDILFYRLHPSDITSTIQLYRQTISQQGGLHRAQQQAVGLKVGVCEVFRLKWLRNCGRYSAFRCLVLWGLSWVIKTCITLKDI